MAKKRENRDLTAVFVVINAVLAVLLIFGAVIFMKVISEKPHEPIATSSGELPGSVFPEDVFGVPVITELMSPTIPARTGIKREIRYIVVHETDNTARGADAKSHSIFLTGGNAGETSWHYTVDDHEIYHHMPDDELAWHVGDTVVPHGGNRHGVGIELCVNSDGDFEKTLVNGAKLVAYLLHSYDLDMSAVTMHGDFIDKNCPSNLRGDDRWPEFLRLVKENYDENEVSTSGTDS